MQSQWNRFFAKRTRKASKGCILWNLCRDDLGYGRSTKCANEVKAHRISWALAFGPVPDSACVLHTCDVRHCVNPDHLWLGTQQDNIRDMNEKGRGRAPTPRFGTANPMARLNEDDVWAIRIMIKQEMFSQREIASDYDVSPMTISRIANNQTWPHVTDN